MTVPSLTKRFPNKATAAVFSGFLVKCWPAEPGWQRIRRIVRPWKQVVNG